MPQLDKVTYFTQFFWLFFFYASFYLILVKYYLPRIARVLHARTHKAAQGSTQQEAPLTQEKTQLEKHTLEQVSEACVQTKQALQNCLQKTAVWLTQTTQSIHAKQLQKVNATYSNSMRGMMEESAHAFSILKSILPPTSQYTSLVSAKNNVEKKHMLYQVTFVQKLLMGKKTPQPKMGKEAPQSKMDSKAPHPKMDSKAQQPKMDIKAPQPKMDSKAPHPKMDSKAPQPKMNTKASQPKMNTKAPQPTKSKK
jgi:F0F1-type ATP synthase membrane subunit b/b'